MKNAKYSTEYIFHVGLFIMRAIESSDFLNEQSFHHIALNNGELTINFNRIFIKKVNESAQILYNR